MKINIYKTEDDLLSAFADYFIETAQSFIAERGAFNVNMVNYNGSWMMQ